MLIFSRWLAPTQLDNKKSIPSASNVANILGAIKSSSRPAPTGKPKQTTKKQSKVNKPQKAKANSAADKLQKKYCAGLITKTEKMLGERAGHLELIGKGKKADKSEKGLNKGGSRRYG
ncbi:hypothetical protein VDGE_00185 [Verticillium dahliae]|uniref:Uncharacterized protein n=1 Tax=Verticillium dahliae TaxID=27337 RepID=A0A444RVJ7_VERDA|nr:hypothetical protein VDGE_00185 [Verticillium dahliae]